MIPLFIAFLIIYGLTAGVSLERHSLAPHFVYLAESFLHGHLDLVHIPAPLYDLTPFEGRWYVSFPPLPALLMLPLVALRGLAVSDIAFSVVVGALNVALVYAVLARSGIGDRRSGIGERRAGIWLCALMGLGTPLWYCAALGSVWYTAHVVAVTCLCLYALEVLDVGSPEGQELQGECSLPALARSGDGTCAAGTGGLQLGALWQPIGVWLPLDE